MLLKMLSISMFTLRVYRLRADDVAIILQNPIPLILVSAQL